MPESSLPASTNARTHECPNVRMSVESLQENPDRAAYALHILLALALGSAVCAGLVICKPFRATVNDKKSRKGCSLTHFRADF